MPSSQNSAFGAGVNHLTASGRGNDQSVTLMDAASGAAQALQQDADKFMAATPHGVLANATGGSPADTDAGVEFGQQGLGDQNDAAMAGQSWDRALMGRAAGIGQDDEVA